MFWVIYSSELSICASFEWPIMQTSWKLSILCFLRLQTTINSTSRNLYGVSFTFCWTSQVVNFLSIYYIDHQHKNDHGWLPRYKLQNIYFDDSGWRPIVYLVFDFYLPFYPSVNFKIRYSIISSAWMLEESMWGMGTKFSNLNWP